VLTRRELEIAQLIAQGLGNKQIGRRLGISDFTVREHVRRVAQKLQVSSRSAIAARIGPSADRAL
jgi:two-component system nitrate/nitrite response regulator NarL